MIQEPIQQGIHIPDEASTKRRCFHEGLEASDLETVKDFFGLHAALGCGNIGHEKGTDV